MDIQRILEQGWETHRFIREMKANISETENA